MKVISLGENLEFDEEWLKKQIIQNPKLLNLGNLEFEVAEKNLGFFGKSDILMNSADRKNLYVIEVMLGDLDESHIVRGILYYLAELYAVSNKSINLVFIAEDFNNRFFEVVYFLANYLPILFIQVTAFENLMNESGNGELFLYFSQIPNKMKKIRRDDGLERNLGFQTNEEYWASRLDSEQSKFLQGISSSIMELNSGIFQVYSKNSITFEVEDVLKEFMKVEVRKSDLVFTGILPLNFKYEAEHYHFSEKDLSLTESTFQLKISNSNQDSYKESFLILLKNSFGEFKRLYLKLED